MFYLSYIHIALRLGVAILAGGIVGYERERKGRDAGFRTHILVAVGACLFALIELETASRVVKMAASNENVAQVITFSAHRLTAQVVSGIGFLGAGTIIMTKRSIKGLTTAASIWVCAALGMAAGMGYYLIAGGGSLAILLTLIVIKRLFSFPHMKKIRISYTGTDSYNLLVESHLKRNQIRVLGMNARTMMEEGRVTQQMEYHVDTRHLANEKLFMKEINELGVFQQILVQDLGDDF